MPFPQGLISVQDPLTRDETAGRDWVMETAENVRFLSVCGTIWIGDTSLWYEFTLVEDHVYIDEISWLIFTILGGASDTEFSYDFFCQPSARDGRFFLPCKLPSHLEGDVQIP